MSTTQKQIGDILLYSNDSGADIAVDAIIVIGDAVAIAIVNIANGESGSVAVAGVHELAALTAGVWKQGDELWWDDANDKLTHVAGGNTYAGIAAADKANAATVAEVLLNVRGPVAPELLNRVWEDVAVDKTLDIQDVGKVMNITVDAKTITLPAVAAGLTFIIRNGGADAAVAVNVSPDANDKIMGADLAGADNKDRINTKATAKRGDYLKLVYGGATGWLVTVERGTWAAEA